MVSYALILQNLANGNINIFLKKWTPVIVSSEEEGLTLVPANPEEYFTKDFLDEMDENSDLRIWWPSNVEWRQFK